MSSITVMDRAINVISQLQNKENPIQTSYESLFNELFGSRLSLGHPNLDYDEVVLTSFSLIYELYEAKQIDIYTKESWQWTAIQETSKDWPGDTIPKDLQAFLNAQRLK